MHKITSFSLFYLQRQIQSTNRKIDGLRVDGSDLAEQVQNQLSLIADKTCQQLWNPDTTQ